MKGKVLIVTASTGIAAAFAQQAAEAEAQRKAQGLQQEQMQQVAGGLQLPFKLPF